VDVVVVVGPTAAGKTDLAIALAGALGGEIISADSRQIYRGMDYGTAKATPEQRARVPHHLLDVVDPDQVLTLAEYQRMAYEAIADVQGARFSALPGRAVQAVRPSSNRGFGRSQRFRRTRSCGPRWNVRRPVAGAKALHARLAVLDPHAAGPHRLSQRAPGDPRPGSLLGEWEADQ